MHVLVSEPLPMNLWQFRQQACREQSHQECMRKYTCSSVKRGEKRARNLHLEVEVFGTKLGYLGSEFTRVVFGNGRKNGRVDRFPCYDKR